MGSVKAPERDAESLLERIANVLGVCLALGSMNRKTGALSAALAPDERWAEVMSQVEVGSAPVFPGARLGAVAALLHRISEELEIGVQFEQVSLVAEETRIVFQRCPWNEREVVFVVLPDNEGAATTFALLRLVLESVRRDVAIVRAPRVEARCWN